MVSWEAIVHSSIDTFYFLGYGRINTIYTELCWTMIVSVLSVVQNLSNYLGRWNSKISFFSISLRLLRVFPPNIVPLKCVPLPTYHFSIFYNFFLSGSTFTYAYKLMPSFSVTSISASSSMSSHVLLLFLMPPRHTSSSSVSWNHRALLPTLTTMA